MSYHDAVKRMAWDEDDGERSFYYEDGGDCQCGDPGCPGDCESGDEDLDDEGRLRQRITDAMPEGDPEAYMASGQELLDELLANPDREKLSLILDKEVEELQALLGDTSDIDLAGLKEAAMQAFDAATEGKGSSRGAVMAALAAIKEAGGRALRALGLTASKVASGDITCPYCKKSWSADAGADPAGVYGETG